VEPLDHRTPLPDADHRRVAAAKTLGAALTAIQRGPKHRRRQDSPPVAPHIHEANSTRHGGGKPCQVS
jgi:hypothetical protein